MFGAVATKGGVVEGETAGKSLVGDQFSFGVARRMAVAAGQDRIDEVGAALGFGCFPSLGGNARSPKEVMRPPHNNEF